jgi:hypothetical protein
MVVDQLRRLGDDDIGIPQAELESGPGEKRVEVALGKSLAYPIDPRAGQVGERSAAPQGERLSQQGGSPVVGHAGVVGCVDEPVEAVHVDLLRVGVQHVAAGAAANRRRRSLVGACVAGGSCGVGEQPAQACEMGVEDFAWFRRWIGIPHAVDQSLDRDRMAELGQQDREHDAPLRRPWIERPPACADRQRAEDSELCHAPPTDEAIARTFGA